MFFRFILLAAIVVLASCRFDGYFLKDGQSKGDKMHYHKSLTYYCNPEYGMKVLNTLKKAEGDMEVFIKRYFLRILKRRDYYNRIEQPILCLLSTTRYLKPDLSTILRNTEFQLEVLETVFSTLRKGNDLMDYLVEEDVPSVLRAERSLKLLNSRGLYYPSLKDERFLLYFEEAVRTHNPALIHLMSAPFAFAPKTEQRAILHRLVGDNCDLSLLGDIDREFLMSQYGHEDGLYDKLQEARIEIRNFKSTFQKRCDNYAKVSTSIKNAYGKICKGIYCLRG